MANRSYLYSISFDATAGKKDNDKIFGLSEWSYSIPISFKILVSQDTKLFHSIIWDYEAPISIQGNFKKGKQKLFDFLEKLKDENIFDQEELNKHIAETKNFLDNNELENIILECGEIYQMNNEELEVQNQQLFEEICNIDQTIDNFWNELKLIKSSLEELYAEQQKRANQGFLARLFSSNPSKNLSKIKELENAKNDLFVNLGIYDWTNILYYDFSNED